MMPRQILVPLDSSVLAEMALPNAVAMARATGSSLILLQVVPSAWHTRSAGWGIPHSAVTQSQKEVAATAHAYLWGIEGQLRAKGIDVTSRVREGDPAKVIVSEATQDPSITLIVMSTHGRSGLGRFFFGSVSEKVLHASPLPLLLVRSDERKKRARPPYEDTYPAYSTMMVPLDGSALAERALQEARLLATATEATLVLVSATPPLPVIGMSMYMEATSYQLYADVWQEESERMAAYLREKADSLRAGGLQVKTHMAYGNPAEVILEAVDQVEPDLIVMSTHGGGSSGALQGLQELLLGSVALKLVQEARLPVLLIPTRDAPLPQGPAGEPLEASVEPTPSAGYAI
jgi:nucleotide-binding universal stress UspA family protein